jgi:hypothetical protein
MPEVVTKFTPATEHEELAKFKSMRCNWNFLTTI